MKISKDTIIADVLREVKGSVEVFNAYNMACFSCMGVHNETIERGCIMHGVDIEDLIADLQKIS